jgi:hypothetical protein
MKLNFTLLLIFCVFTGLARAQEDCATILSKAQKLYDAGSIEQIPQLLAGCLEHGFTKDEQVQAKKLIILSHLFTNHRAEAEAAMLNFLRENPEYTLASNDQTEFVNLYHEFINVPIASLGISGGLDVANAIVLKRFGVYDLQQQKGNYSSSPGFHAGVTYSRSVSDHLNVNIEAFYAQYGLLYKLNDMFSFTNLSVTEKYTTIGIPLSLVYSFKKLNKITPYARVGMSANYLLKSTQLLVRTFTDNASKDMTSPENDITPERNTFTLSALAGAGMKYHVTHGFIFGDIRYFFSLMNIVKTSMRYSQPDNVFNYYYIDNDFKINNWQFTVGYCYTFYKPRKR